MNSTPSERHALHGLLLRDEELRRMLDDVFMELKREGQLHRDIICLTVYKDRTTVGIARDRARLARFLSPAALAALTLPPPPGLVRLLTFQAREHGAVGDAIAAHYAPHCEVS